MVILSILLKTKENQVYYKDMLKQLNKTNARYNNIKEKDLSQQMECEKIVQEFELNCHWKSWEQVLDE